MAEDVLAIFLRWPEPGQVKTRLAEATGADAACRVYRAMTEHVLGRVQALPASIARVACFTPANREEDVRAWLQPLGLMQCVPQAEGDLTARLDHALAVLRSQGYRRVIFIGTDSPTLLVGELSQAFTALKQHPVALGLCEDGGYYAIGLGPGVEGLFHEIPWSTAGVGEATLARAAARGYTVHRLADSYDMDTVEDLQRLAGELGAGPGEEALKVVVHAVLKSRSGVEE